MGLDLSILIDGDPKGFIEAVDQIKAKSEDLNSTLEGVGTKAALGFAAFSGAIIGSLVAFHESEQVAAQLSQTLVSTGNSANFTSQQLLDLATKFEGLSVFGDEAVATAETILLKFRKIGPEALEPATQASLNLATAMHTDLASAAQLVGKALEDPERGLILLQKQGVGFTESQKAMIKTLNDTGESAKAQAIIFQQMNIAFGGSAAAATQGLGVFIQLKEALGDIVEGVGKQFAPSFSSAGKVLLEFAQYVRDNDTVLQIIARTLAAGAGMAGFVAAVTLGTLAISKIISTLEILQLALGATRIQFALMAGAATLGIGLIIAFLPEIIAFCKDFVGAFMAAKDALVKTFVDMFTNLGQIIVKYLELYASLFDWKKILTGDLSGITSAGKALSDAVSKTVTDAFKDVKDVKQAVHVKFDTDSAAGAKAAADKAAADEAAAAAGQKLREQQAAEDRKAAAAALAEKRRQGELEVEMQKANTDLIGLEKQKRIGDQAKYDAQELQLQSNLNNAKTDGDRKFAEMELREFNTAQEKKKEEVVKYKEQEIKLIKEAEEAKTADQRQAAQEKLAEFQAGEDAHIAAVIAKSDEERLEKQNKQIQDHEEKKAIQAEFDALDDEDRQIAMETDLAKLDESQLARRDALIKYGEDEAKVKSDQRAKQVTDQTKYGATYATINAALNSNEIKGVATAAGQLAELTASKNSTLKGIGKAAAITQIGIDTAKSAMSIYSGFATIPIIGPVLGVAGAAAAIIFGAEKANTVRSAATGGIVPGTGAGDIMPFMLEPGEGIIPKQLVPTFQDQFGKGAVTPDESAPAKTSSIQIGSIIGTEEFVKGSLIPAIRDAVQLENANLGVG